MYCMIWLLSFSFLYKSIVSDDSLTINFDSFEQSTWHEVDLTWSASSLGINLSSTYDTTQCHSFYHRSSRTGSDSTGWITGVFFTDTIYYYYYYIGCFGNLDYNSNSKQLFFPYFEIDMEDKLRDTAEVDFDGFASVTVTSNYDEMIATTLNNTKNNRTTNLPTLSLTDINTLINADNDNSIVTVTSTLSSSIFLFTHAQNGLILVIPHNESDSGTTTRLGLRKAIHAPLYETNSNDTLKLPCMVEDTNRNWIWSMGGLTDSSVNDDSWLAAFNISNETWIHINTTNTVIGDEKLFLNYGSCVFSETFDALIYVGGIQTDSNKLSKDIYVYRIEAKTWVALGGVLRSAHVYGDSTISNDVVYTVGGIDANASYLEKFDLGTFRVTPSYALELQSGSAGVYSVSCMLIVFYF